MLALACSICLFVSQPAADALGPMNAQGVGRARPGLSGPQARLMAQRAAEVIAARNLVAQTGQGGIAGCEPSPQIHVSGVITGQRYSRPTFQPDGSAHVTATTNGPASEWGTWLNNRLQQSLRSFRPPTNPTLDRPVR